MAASTRKRTKKTASKAAKAAKMPDEINVFSPIDGELMGGVEVEDLGSIPAILQMAENAFREWRDVPAPKRGDLIRVFGEVLRERKEDLAVLISRESGKILAEGYGEVQEMIDICEFAVGLSRQLYGLTIASERPGHRMMEQWHPLGTVLVISAFNFPAAVWAWNFALAVVCGNPVIWKPSELTPLTAALCGELFDEAKNRWGHRTPPGLSQIVMGFREHAERLIDAPQVRLVSATGSCAMGRAVKRRVAEDLGKRCLLELGGNNAMIITPSANLDLAVRAAVFSAVGTAGQRCTTLRRAIPHDSIYDEFMGRLIKAYKGITVGHPLLGQALVGPLRTKAAYESFFEAIRQATKVDGGKLLVGGHCGFGTPDLKTDVRGYYVHPAIVAMPSQTDIVRTETFAPLLYAMRYRDLDEAIAMQNDVPQGLSSSIFTTDMREAERFMAASGSDCGIANVNFGPSGAEIGGAFGGEKDTGGGRESGSDSWRNYMRRTTNTVNYSNELPLAQGLKFE